LLRVIRLIGEHGGTDLANLRRAHGGRERDRSGLRSTSEGIHSRRCRRASAPREGRKGIARGAKVHSRSRSPTGRGRRARTGPRLPARSPEAARVTNSIVRRELSSRCAPRLDEPVLSRSPPRAADLVSRSAIRLDSRTQVAGSRADGLVPNASSRELASSRRPRSAPRASGCVGSTCVAATNAGEASRSDGPRGSGANGAAQQ